MQKDRESLDSQNERDESAMVWFQEVDVKTEEVFKY